MPDPLPASSAAVLTPGSLQGRRVLVAEDEFLLAEELREELAREGAEVLGPVPTVAAALMLLRKETAPDLAVLDINLQGEKVWPVADALRACGVPFVFTTGYDLPGIPQAYADIPRAEKPAEPGKILRLLRSVA